MDVVRVAVSKTRDINNSIQAEGAVWREDTERTGVPEARDQQTEQMSYTNTMYHIVLRTHRSEPTIVVEHERDLYAYIMGIVNNMNGKLYRVGGMPDHVHLLVSLPATLAMSKFVQDLKVSTSKWLKANMGFPHFDGWSREYAGFRYGVKDKDMIVNYIKNQKEHHRRVSFREEYMVFLQENGMTIDERYMMKE